MAAMKWFYSFLKKHNRSMALGLVLVTVISVLAIAKPIVSGSIVDDVITDGQYELLPRLIALLILITVLRGVLRFWSQVIFETCSQDVLYSMRDTVYRKLLQQDFNFYNKKRTGDLLSRQTGDMDAIRHFIAFVIYQVYENVFLFFFALIMVFTVSPKLALCMCIVLPFALLVTLSQTKNGRPRFQKIREQFSSLNTFVQENISGNRVVKAFSKEDYEIGKFNKENDGYRDAELAAAEIWTKYVPQFEFLSNMLTIILMLVGSIMVINQSMTLGNYVTINGYLWMLMNPLRQIGWRINDIQRFTTSVEKIYTTYSEEPNVKFPAKAIPCERLNGDIEFKNVSYSADDEDIIHQINFRVKSGQTVGILGSTGSGKSTIMNLLCRFYDVTDGEVLVDGKNVKDLDLYNLRQNIGMAMQDVFLFSDTIEGNIAYSNPDCSFEAVEKAAIMADADSFIRQMPDGYDTIVGERGVGLSGGQKQRISLARALLKEPSILILDDTTSAVDMETESYIQQQLNAIDHKCTIFVVAYRISSIKDSDLILVLNNGRIVEQGTHQELLQNNGYYATVFRHQYGEFEKYVNELSTTSGKKGGQYGTK
ncbi:MAG: ABC transporter ATP-binding protein [Lachnospiraceae bacterium]|nr:ABC transporter ATP-binding protein [Lachnospiraceae bacterium]MCI9400017.1 ABC transporter ATP-binding protein [Lachnospiraceae bacterium]MCX4379184.1 ABC transporter ATP-binding protein [Lachnospiraceae bacterium]